MLGRILLIAFALLIAVFAAMLSAGASLILNFIRPEWFASDADPIERGWFFASGFVSTNFGYVFLLTAILIAIAEAMRIRSVLYYAVAGGAAGAFAYFTADIAVRLDQTTDIAPISNSLPLVAAAGIIGGAVYWLVAGRRAGEWREPPASDPSRI